ncbi:putative bifunctional diguanylate cyclase/phosphodiesterase [Planococcus sp. YIM B11945]|uniref:putative bifunctional diguanylate cyclase/phosphodiesterase n=1 Tax=Planococcus sp. YIM B11945 TaxID=3435410 RepID=UPI003D7ED7E3
MTVHRLNNNYISEADLTKRRFFRLIGKVMGYGNFLGSLLFGAFIMLNDSGASLKEYPVPFGMFCLGIFSLWLDKTTLKETTQQHLYGLNYISIPLIIFYFIDDGATTTWAIIFIYLMMAIVLQSIALVFYSFFTSLVVLFSVMLLVPADLLVSVTFYDHILRAVLLIVATASGLIGLRNIKKREKMLFHYMDRAEEVAFQDPMLKIPNRMDFNLYVDHALKSGPIVLWKVEINHFQSVYDVLGHHKSDELLEMVKMRLTGKLDATSYLAKGEGSTFLVATKSEMLGSQAEAYFEEMLEAILHPYILELHDYLLSFNIGVACSRLDGSTSDELMRHAQFALDRAKELGLNRVVLCSEDIKNETMKQVQVSEALYQANLDNEFHLVYQPQIEMKTNQIIGLEALLRWEHPHMGTIPPNEFIDIAEKNGFIVPLGKWILEKACQEIQVLSHSVGRPLKLAVNVSFIQIRQDDFVRDTLTILEKTGFPADQLEIELTERSLFENRLEDLLKIEQLRSKGIRIAIDDFGTGYSSFGILAKVKVDKIKVPREFIEHIDSNQNSQRIVETITSMADLFQITCLAEGIERIEENDFLLQMICQEAQGYFYAKPAAICAIEKWLTAEMTEEAVLAGLKK